MQRLLNQARTTCERRIYFRPHQTHRSFCVEPYVAVLEAHKKVEV